MPDFLTPTTTLEAVNEMLRTIGESPVTTVESTDPLPVDVEIALNALRFVNREVQARGWHFNTEADYPLPRDGSGFVPIPTNALRVDTADEFSKYDVVVRGQRLYDREEHTFVFPEDLKATIVFVLPFEDLPEPARNYITIRAARRFQAGQVGSQILSALTVQDETDARALLLDEEGDSADYNVLTGTFDMFEATQRY